MNAYANRRFAHKQLVYIKFHLQINILKIQIILGSTVQGELAALAVRGVVKQPVYIKFQLQIITPKIRSLAALVYREVVFR